MKLRDLGHPDYMKKEETISCSTKLELAESMVAIRFIVCCSLFLFHSFVILYFIICFFFNGVCQVSDAEETLKEWKTTIKEMHKSYSKLLFFSVSKVLSLHTIPKDSVFSADKMIQEIGFLFENSPTAI